MKLICLSCDSDWTEGEFAQDCQECGGGAMTRACVVCLGQCGNPWTRAPQDSNDAGEAHWMGHCALPRDEQMEIMRRRAKEEL